MQKSETSSPGAKSSHTGPSVVFPCLAGKSDMGGPSPCWVLKWRLNFDRTVFQLYFLWCWNIICFMCLVFGVCVLKSPEYMELCLLKVGSTEKYRTHDFKTFY